MKRQIKFILYALFGVLGTIGGWWFFLSLFGFTPTFPGPFTLLNLIIGMVTIATLYSILLFGGPFIIYDSIKEYQKEGEV